MKKIVSYFFILCVFFFYSNLSIADEINVFFFNPDISLNSMVLIKTMGLYLKNTDERIRLQPFREYDDMEKMVKSKKAKFVIASHWYYSMEREKYQLEPILISIKDNKYFYQKMLIVRENYFNDIKKVKGKLATTSLGKNYDKFLEKNLFQQSGIEKKNLTLIWVRKDVDALLALKFGRVNSALVRKKSIDMITKKMPHIMEGLCVIHTSDNIIEAPLCVYKNHTTSMEINEIKKIFINMDKTEDGRKILSLLGYDKWIIISKEDLQ